MSQQIKRQPPPLYSLKNGLCKVDALKGKVVAQAGSEQVLPEQLLPGSMCTQLAAFQANTALQAVCTKHGVGKVLILGRAGRLMV